MLLAFNFFDTIVNFFTLLWDMINNTISSIINLIAVVNTGVTIPLKLVSVVPGFIGSSILLVVGIGILKLLLGWGNS